MARGGGSGSRGGGGSFGGSRGSGGRTSFGGSRGGRSFGNSNSGRSSSGGSWGNRTPRVGPIFRGGPTYRNYGSGPGFGRGPRGSGGCGCSVLITVIIIIIGIILFMSLFTSSNNNSSGNPNNITVSTIEREALPKGAVNETSYFTDQAGWISNQTQMTQGLRHFYQETGVQPHVYITDYIAGESIETINELSEYANDLYDELFTDEAHLLLVFYEPSPNDYMMAYITGTAAKQVIDTEAGDILLDYLDRNYYNGNLTDEQFFSNSFRDAADRIMAVTTSPWIPVFTIGGIILLVGILFVWWKKRQEKVAIEQKRTDEILNRPIETFGKNSEADELAKKYEE